MKGCVARCAAVFLALSLVLAPRVASAQVDFTGQWSPLYHQDGPDRIPGPELGDYTGLPLNDRARLRADSYDPDRISVVSEYICREHGGQGRATQWHAGKQPLAVWRGRKDSGWGSDRASAPRDARFR